MKYEITKGSEKDFEQAPEWALFVVGIPGFSDRVFVEALSSGARHQFIGSERVSQNSDLHEDRYHYLIAERRPITEPVVNQQLTTEWGEDGLPPVGSIFEMRNKPKGIWCTTELIAAGQEQIIYFREGREFSGHKNNYEFRPIRSPEDLARDEAIKAMREALGHAAGLIEVSNIYRAIAAGKIPGVKLEAL